MDRAALVARGWAVQAACCPDTPAMPPMRAATSRITTAAPTVMLIVAEPRSPAGWRMRCPLSVVACASGLDVPHRPAAAAAARGEGDREAGRRLAGAGAAGDDLPDGDRDRDRAGGQVAD